MFRSFLPVLGLVVSLGISAHAQNERIAFTYQRNNLTGANADICSIKPNGGDFKRLTTHPACDKSPAISPDGSKILFMSDRDNNGDGVFNPTCYLCSIYSRIQDFEDKHATLGRKFAKNGLKA